MGNPLSISRTKTAQKHLQPGEVWTVYVRKKIPDDPLYAGTFGVQITGNCAAIPQFIISTFAFDDIVASNCGCYGSSTGSITVTTLNAVGDVEYSINGGLTWQSSGTFTGLSAGNYTIKARDAQGVVITSDVQTISQPTQISFDVAHTDENSGDDGTITISNVAGGGAPYETNIDGEWTLGKWSYTGLSDGTYSVQVRDGNGCTVSQDVTIDEAGSLQTDIIYPESSSKWASLGHYSAGGSYEANNAFSVQWIGYGTGYTMRIFVEFDLSSLPDGITAARLKWNGLPDDPAMSLNIHPGNQSYPMEGNEDNFNAFTDAINYKESQSVVSYAHTVTLDSNALTQINLKPDSFKICIKATVENSNYVRCVGGTLRIEYDY